MKVQLDDKSKAEFIEHIAKDSITCWFDGDEFVMPSGQGRTARGIVLGKLLVWQHQQSKIDELQKKNAWLSDVAERENNRANNLQQDKTSTTILLGKTIQEKNELQKRVDAVKALIEEYRDPPTEDKTFQHALSIVAYELEQALKGGEE
ncbi:hypothetical protein F943_02150 [Acinetobacter ursingii NIPH 706]|uniref:hypothetical protein n=1 Tax=Acinetobacter ursingii TaxID=108980 RepID=UPI0002CFA6CE|nr:hypothetical protein [Acinetobacter ursingii]ENX48618.1 hypothetical protein F943_02150 [Acinetobacter ursingii NIPH 706]